MPTNIDTGLTVQDAVNADHSPHIFTMSNGDLLVLYYNGTNLIWRSKSGGVWSAANTITLDAGVTPPNVSYWTRHGDVILGVASKDPIDATHNGDVFELTYTPSTHTLATTAKTLDNGDGNEKAAGVGYTSGAGANDQVQVLHGNAAGNFSTIQEYPVGLGTTGVDQVPTMGDLRSSARTGLVTDGATTTYLMYAIASTGTAFKVERFVAGTNADNVESPPAPAANLAGVTAVYDGTNYVFIANENNAKLRYLTRTGTNTYGSWTDILSDASLVGQPAVCVKSGGDLAVFYQTNKNQVNGEIWVVQRTSGTWGSPALLAGSAATGWSNPSCAASDLNDTGVARLVYVTGTASTWTLVEDSYTFGSGGGSTPVSVADSLAITDSVSVTTSFTLADSLALSDVLASVAASFTLPDSLAITDALAGLAASFALADSLTLSDALAGITATLAIADSLALSDTLSGASASFTLPDSLTLTDAVSLGTPIALADALTLTDAVSVHVALTVPDSLTLSDTLAGLTARFTLVDSLALVDAVALVNLLTIADSLALTDALAGLSASFAIPDTLALTDALAGLSAALAVADTLLLGDALAGVTASLSVADSLLLSDSASAVNVIPAALVPVTYPPLRARDGKRPLTTRSRLAALLRARDGKRPLTTR